MTSNDDGFKPAPDSAWSPLDHPGLDSAFLWKTLCHQQGVRIVVLTADGRFVFADEAVNARYAPPGETVVGKQVADVVEPKLAMELIKVARDVVRHGEPVAVYWVARGLGICSSAHPLPGSWRGQRLVLVASHDKVCGIRPSPTDSGVRVVRPIAKDLGPLSVLTRRELQILALIADGLTSAQIAERLGRSVKTVEWHRVSIGQKLGLKSRVDLAQIGLIAGIGGDLDRLRAAAGFVGPNDEPSESEHEASGSARR